MQEHICLQWRSSRQRLNYIPVSIGPLHEGGGMLAVRFMVGASLLLLLAARAHGEYEWSGFINSFGGTLNFTCPDSLVVSGVASDFSTPTPDRRWEFQCATGGGLANVSTTCTLQGAINSLENDIIFNCPNNGYIAGFTSEFTPARTDRVWRPYCCTRPYSSLINCQTPTASWENLLRGNLNYSAPQGYVVAGVQSFYFNRDRRWRFTVCQVEVNCGDPGTPANAQREGSSFLYTEQLVFSCDNGYYQSSGPEGGVRTCRDTGLWSGTQPTCTLCTEIPHCADTRCSNASDHTCFLCESNNGPARGEAAYRNLVTECHPLCSWLDAFCYPGVCPDDPTSCNCSEGFQGPNCLNITVSPMLETCSLTLRGLDGREIFSTCFPPTNTSTPPPTFTNVPPSELEADWNSLYPGPSSPPSRPAYVTGFSVGVARSEIRATVYRAANPTQGVTMTTHSCGGPSPDVPVTVLSMCSARATPTNLSTHNFLHGDTFEVLVYVASGGYLNVTNQDTGVTQRHYYSGSPTIGQALFVIDLEPPTHCSLVASETCLTNQIILSLGSNAIVSSATVTAVWGGWVDIPAGVMNYEIDIFHLVERDNVLYEGDRVDSMLYQHTGQTTYTHVEGLPAEGPYSFVLQTMDQANNTRTSRRLLLYDATSRLAINASAPLRVISAVPDTGFLWQNSTTDPLVVSGRGHFYNTILLENDYLAPVANHSAVSPEYDHPLDSGSYPRQGIPNALGVTQLRYRVTVDQEGGTSVTSITRPTTFPLQSSDIGIESVEISVNVQDGDSVRVWFQAFDFRIRDQYDSVLVHVDSSPPVTQDLWLEYSSVTGLALHGTESLLDLSIQFRAHDEHSGLSRVEWWIGMEPGARDVGSGNVPIENVAEAACNPPMCVCDSLGHCHAVQHTFSPLPSHFTASHEALHDTDYYITLIVTNHALLTSSLSHHITIDTTPPLPGAVFDGPLGSGDLDYQQDLTMHAWWSGFFDRETDVAFYQYVFDSTCANSSLFTIPLAAGGETIQTTDTNATWVAPTTGTFYVTVVAFNQALCPSPPICSDGVTIDMTPPTLRIPLADIRPGLALDVLGNVWFINATRERQMVAPPTEECVNRSSLINDLSPYPVRMEGTIPVTVDPMLCSRYDPFTPTVTFLTTSDVLNVSWIASDNTGIREFRFGIINTEDFSGDPRGISYVSTGLQTHYSVFNLSLISNGRRLVISVVAVDLALHRTVVTVGPFVVDTTPPLVNGSLAVEGRGSHVTVMWDEGTFTDPENGQPLTSFEYAIGRSEYGAQVQQFQPLPSSPTLPCTTPHCVAIATTPLLSGHQYYFTVKIRNRAGLSTSLSSPPYTHASDPPSQGVVCDIDPNSIFNITSTGLSLHNEDVNILVDSQQLAASWNGFEHAHLEVSYSVGLGSRPGIDDVVSFTTARTQSRYMFSNLQLTHGSRYFVTVVAETSTGRTNASSDGVLVLLNIARDVLPRATVYDGGDDMDTDYQLSTTFASAHWFFPPAITQHLSHYRWAILRAVGGDTSNLILVRAFENVGRQTLAAAGGLVLREGELYVSAVQPCYASSCLPPVYSDGFQVATRPGSTYINASYTPLEWNGDTGTSSVGTLQISWPPFTDPRLTYYEWSLGTGDLGYELLIYWNRVEWFENQVLIPVSETVSLHTRNTVTLRGYNMAGLHSSVSTSLYWNVSGEVLPQESVPRSPRVVLDISESQAVIPRTVDWRQLEYQEGAPRDIEYTNSTSSLSAAWPLLRYKRYRYSISATPTFKLCTPPSPTCGSTIANAVTVNNLQLTNGQMYFVCVQALGTDAIHPTTSTPAVLTACSNGVTVDPTPPEGSCVQIVPPRLNESATLGSGGEPSSLGPLLPTLHECAMNSSQFQVSTSEIHIIWNQFLDVEQYGTAVHATGVAYYEYAIGTSPRAVDVVGFTSVGVATEAIARGLSLQSGHTYYATVRAYDFVGQWSDVVSSGVTVDTSPPAVTRPWLEGTTDRTQPLRLRWEPVREWESQVESVEWGVGSRPGSSDLQGWTVANTGEISGAASVGERQDGRLVFLSVKAQNGALLSSLAVSPGYILDSSPPLKGSVYDGPRPGAGDILDLDYTTIPGELSGHWEGFSDPHTGVAEYLWAIGSCAGCSDMQTFTSAGIATEVTRTGLMLTSGRRYYITVRGCNSVGLCSEASSNGITVDVTPPIAGRVCDGYSGPDLQFQASRTLISAHWHSFHDSQSSLQHYVYYVGLVPNDSSIIRPTLLPPSESSLLLPAPMLLPINRRVYTTLVAYNRAGLSTTVSSDGVYIDDTPPQSIGPVTIDTQWAGSASMATQYSSSVVRVTWGFTDTLTAINQHFWSLVSREGVRVPLPGKNAGSQNYGTCVGLQLADGESYSARVTACNTAGLCLQQTSAPVLVDSSPPIDGYFAVRTNSAAEIDRTVPGGMTWRNRPVRGYAQLNIAFLGFSDPHSGIAEYWATVGSSYSGSDLTSGAIRLQSSLASQSGTRLALVILTRLLDLRELVYVSIWAVNGAGLRSHIVQGSFSLDPLPQNPNNGSLVLVRSFTCTPESCLGHCTCAARGQLCSATPALLSSCQPLNAASLSSNMLLRVYNVVPQLRAGADMSVLFTAVTDKLEGRWESVEPRSTAFQRLEWSVGEKGFTPGAGLIDTINDAIWRDAGTSLTAVFTVSSSYPLQHGVAYVFHVRAWYSNSTYAVFSSEGVTVDTAGPEVPRGLRVRETDEEFGSQVDIDFTSNASQVATSWDGVFVPFLTGNYSTFEVGLGNVPETGNVVSFSPVPSGTTSTLLAASSLRQAQRYYATVRAISPLGITTTSISDGFVVDLTPPNVGVVLDGLRYHDARAQSNTSSYSARWFGFNDPESGIHHYEVAVTPTISPPDKSSYHDVGIRLKATLNGLNLTQGQTYYTHIVAVNMAGLRSQNIVSSGRVIDTTKPSGVQCVAYGMESLANPSFEGVTGPSIPCSMVTADAATQGWTLGVSYTAVLSSSASFDPFGDGCTSLYFVGAVSQMFSTTPGTSYTLGFALRRFISEDSEHTAIFQARVTAPGLQHIVTISTVVDSWQRFEFVFEAVELTSEIVLSTLNDQYGLIVDEVSVRSCMGEVELVSSDIIAQRWSGVVSVSTEYISMTTTRLYANWNIRDSESGVREYLWAIGTVPGGEQLQRYTSTGNTRHGVSVNLSLTHGTRVYVSVLGWNYASLESVVYYDPYVVDFTPPAVGGGVLDGMGDEDVQYQSSAVVAASWEGITDPDSGISSCRWAVGTSRGSSDIQSFMLSSNSNGTTSDLRLAHGATIYATVVCTNGAGLRTTASSNGVTILTDPPLHANAFGRTSSPVLTEYEPRGGYIPTNDTILMWDGFVEEAGTPLTYEVRVIESGVPQQWNSVGFAKMLTLSDLQLPENVPHTIEVRAVNLAGLASQPLTMNVTIGSTPPIDTGATINSSWTSGNTLLLDWGDKFISSTPLYYEFSIGTQVGSGSVTQWLETDQTTVVLTNARLSHQRDFFLTLTAIGSSGLHTNTNTMVPGMPITG